MSNNGACPCGGCDARGRSLSYEQCCAPLHRGQAAASAEALMRSRYCAFVKEDEAYLLGSWHPSTRPPTLDLEPKVKWLGLEVRQHRVFPNHAEVEFVARSRWNGQGQRQHERSRFVFEAGRWWYVDEATPGQ